jgi:hypothetical protein
VLSSKVDQNKKERFLLARFFSCWAGRIKNNPGKNWDRSRIK